MNCDDCQRELVALLLNELSEERASEVLAHLETGCEVCCSQYRELEASMNRLRSLSALNQIDESSADGEDLQPSRDRVWNVVSQRIQEESGGQAPPDSQPIANQPTTNQPILQEPNRGADASGSRQPIWLAVLAIAAAFLVITSVRLAKNPNRSVFGFNPFRSVQMAETQSPPSFEQDNSIEHLKTVLMTHAENPQISCGLLVVDSFVSQIHVYLDRLPNLDSRDHYVFWFLDESGNAVGKEDLVVRNGSVRQVLDFPMGKIFTSTVITIESKTNPPSQPSDRIAVTQGDGSEEA